MQQPYTCLYRGIWDDPKFYQLSPMGKLIYLYLISAPTGNGLGCFKLAKSTMIDDLRMNTEQFGERFTERFQNGFQECLQFGLLKYDEQTRVILLPTYIKRNPPHNPNVIKGLGKSFARIPNCELKAECFHIVKDFCDSKHETVRERFQKSFGKSFAEPLYYTNPVPVLALDPVPVPNQKDLSLTTGLRPSVREQYDPSVGDPNAGTPLPKSLPRSPTDQHQEVMFGEVDEQQVDLGGAAKPKRRRAKVKEPTPGSLIWEAYAEKYRLIYNAEPLRDAQANTQCKRLHEKFGKDAIPVVLFYLDCQANPYFRARHPLDLLVSHRSQFYTDWQKGQTVTQAEARRVDRQQAQGEVYRRVIEKFEREEAAERAAAMQVPQLEANNG